MIPIEKCKDRRLYRLRARNLAFGVFSAEHKAFFGIREKFSDRYIDTEYDNSATALEEMPDELPSDIVVDSDLGSICQTCRKRVDYIRFADGEREITLSRGDKIKVRGEWQHIEATDCTKALSMSKFNAPLFQWLEQIEARYTPIRAAFGLLPTDTIRSAIERVSIAAGLLPEYKDWTVNKWVAWVEEKLRIEDEKGKEENAR